MKNFFWDSFILGSNNFLFDHSACHFLSISFDVTSIIYEILLLPIKRLFTILSPDGVAIVDKSFGVNELWRGKCVFLL